MQLKAILFCFVFSVLAFGQDNTADAKEIILNAISQISNNDPRLALESFQFKKYSKGIVKTRDTTTLSLVSSENNYIFELLVLHQSDKKQGDLQTVLGANLPGFEQPVYPLFEKTFYSTSVYEKEYEILGKRFHAPLSKNALKHYTFQLKETVYSGQRPYYVIVFFLKNNNTATQLQGELHLDIKSFAVQKAVFKHRENSDITITREFTYFEEEGIWFPQKTSVTATLLNKKEAFDLFGKSIPPGRTRFEDNETETIFTLVSSHHDIQFNKTAPFESRHIDISALEKENTNADEFWNPFRENGLSQEETAIAEEAGFSVRDNNIERRIKRIKDFGLGYYRIGFFDLDLRFLFKYNNYEGFRSGLGGLTNEKLSEHFSINGYLVRGFKDEEFKYQIGTTFLISKKTNTIIGFTYTDDVAEIGSQIYLTDRRTFSLFEPRLLNISQFYKHQTLQTNIQHQINPKINAEIQFSKSDIEQTLPYTFLNEGTSFSNYTLSEAKASVLWAPFGKYIETPQGISEYKISYPRFSTQVTQAFKGIFEGDFNFTKIDFRADHLISHINQSFTEITIEGNLGFGDIPLTHAYHAYPNSPNKETIFQRFSVAGIHSFETMYFGEFFSDKLASIHIKHQLKPFLIASWLKPELVFISRHAIGTASNLENHQNISFNTLEKGYSESGFELNKILLGFGVSFAYRYGAYHLPQFEDNVSFKFTFNLKL